MKQVRLVLLVCLSIAAGVTAVRLSDAATRGPGAEMADAADTIAGKTADKIEEAADKTDRSTRAATTRARSTTRNTRRTTGDVTDRIRKQGEP